MKDHDLGSWDLKFMNEDKRKGEDNFYGRAHSALTKTNKNGPH